MRKDKYSTQIDNLLKAIIHENSPSIGDKNRIVYANEMEKDGSIKKVAFDVYRVTNDPYESLWQLEDIEGTRYLVRSADPQFQETKIANDWSAVSDYDNQNVTLMYKGKPLTRFSSDEYGFNSDVITFKKALLEQVEKDEDFVKSIFANEPEQKRVSFGKTYPELQKFLK